MKILLLELNIFTNIQLGVIYAHMVGFRKPDHIRQVLYHI